MLRVFHMALVAVAFLTTPPAASEPIEYVLDKAAPQSGTGGRKFVVFSARGGGEYFGHAWVVLGQEDARGIRNGMSASEAVGFYPNDPKSPIRAVFGAAPGELSDDWREKADLKVIVLVTEANFAKAKGVIDRWRKDTPNYLLGVKDCTSLVAEVANSIGLRAYDTHAWTLYPGPLQYLNQLVILDFERRATQQAKETVDQVIEDMKKAYRAILDGRLGREFLMQSPRDVAPDGARPRPTPSSEPSKSSPESEPRPTQVPIETPQPQPQQPEITIHGAP